MKKAFKFILVVLWMTLIFMFSAQNAEESGDLSNGIIVKIASLFVSDDLTPEMQMMYIHKFSFILRKTAHFTVYLILGVLVWNFLKEFQLKHIAVIALIICCLYSISDEYHQTFVPGRSGEVRDVCVDTSGALLGIAGATAVSELVKRRKR